MEMRGIVLGAGIAGLSTAIAMQQRNIQVKIFEAAKELKPIGAGILIPPNAMAILARYQLADAVTKAGIPLESMDLVDTKGRTLTRSPAHFSNTGTSYTTVAIHRAALQKILADAVAPETLLTGKACEKINNYADHVELQFSDQTHATADFLIGADGINSKVRQTIFPTSSLRDSGQICWRGISTIALPHNLQKQLTEVWGAGRRFGFVPINETQVYWYATIGSAKADNTKISNDHIHEYLTDIYKNFIEPVQEIIRHTTSSAIRYDKIYDLNFLSQWHANSSLLIGDAAHASTPNLGQGGAQAIEDSWVIAEKIATSKSLDQAFLNFQTLRRPRVKKIVNLSRQIGEFASISNPIACRLRNAFMRWTPSYIASKQSQQVYKLPY